MVGAQPVEPEPAKLKLKGSVKMKAPLPTAGTEEPINLHGVNDEKDKVAILRQENRLRLNLGCGYQQISGFIGVDFDESLDPDVVSQVEDLSWCETDSVDMIYASHVLEHLDMETSRVALKEWLRVLKPAGYLDVAVPDVNQVWLMWKKGAKWGDYAQLCDELYINATAFGANLLADAIPEMQDTYGGPGHQHKQIFIHDMLYERVLEAGFVEVHETTACFLRRSAIGETMIQARKTWLPIAPPPEDIP
jgi:SAM-dependent methyltransferase